GERIRIQGLQRIGVGQQRTNPTRPNVFDIAFAVGEPELQDEGWYGLWGSVTLGDYRESFLASLSLWSPRDYEQQWLDAATRLIRGEERSAFFTSAFQFWWVMWRDVEAVRVHEEVLTPERLEELGPSPDTSQAPYQLIRPYRSVTEEGEAIAEWHLSVADIE